GVSMRNTIIGLLLSVIVLVVCTFIPRTNAQERGSRGQTTAEPAATRGGRGGPPQPPAWLPAEGVVRGACPPGDLRDGPADGYHIKKYINDITAFSRKSRDDGNQFWGRITGTPYDKMTTDWVAAQFKRIGLEQVRIQEFDLPPQWIPASWEVVAATVEKTLSV